MTGSAPPALLLVGSESSVAEELLMVGLQHGFRVHTVRTTSEAMSALAQVLFDVVLFNPFACPELPRLINRDPDLARMPLLGVVQSSWDEAKTAPETSALVFEQGDELIEAIGFLLRRRPPSEPNDVLTFMAQVDSPEGSFAVRLLEVRPRHIRIGSERLPMPGTSVEVRLPWSDEVHKGSVAVTDSGQATIALWSDG